MGNIREMAPRPVERFGAQSLGPVNPVPHRIGPPKMGLELMGAVPLPAFEGRNGRSRGPFDMDRLGSILERFPLNGTLRGDPEVGVHEFLHVAYARANQIDVAEVIIGHGMGATILKGRPPDRVFQKMLSVGGFFNSRGDGMDRSMHRKINRANNPSTASFESDRSAAMSEVLSSGIDREIVETAGILAAIKGRLSGDDIEPLIEAAKFYKDVGSEANEQLLESVRNYQEEKETNPEAFVDPGFDWNMIPPEGEYTVIITKDNQPEIWEIRNGKRELLCPFCMSGHCTVHQNNDGKRKISGGIYIEGPTGTVFSLN